MFTFKINQVLPLLKHSLKATQHRMLYTKGTDVPGLWLVKDSGVYLMSNAKKILRAPGSRKQHVIYAQGWGPETYLGGDDFAELIRAEWLVEIFKKAEAQNRDTFNIELTETKIKLTV